MQKIYHKIEKEIGTPSGQSPLYKPKTDQNYQGFSEDSKNLETRVRTK